METNEQKNEFVVPSEEKKNMTKVMGETFADAHIHEIPCRDAIDGITYDFAHGFRLHIPFGTSKKYRVQFWNMDTGCTLFDGVVKAGDWVLDTKFYYRPLAFRICDALTGNELFLHIMDLKDEEVCVVFDIGTVGDVVAWFKSVVDFKNKHQCKMIVAMKEHIINLFKISYPDIDFVRVEDALMYRPYAVYNMGVRFDEKDAALYPADFRHYPLNHIGYNILGMDARGYEPENPPEIKFESDERIIKEPYVCISTMASGLCKMWWHPFGWDTVVEFLKRAGYRVICIDGQSFMQKGPINQKVPHGAEDFTGLGKGKTIEDRAKMIKYCDFFVGLGSGLSWLSWLMKRPVVLISGFSEKYAEFYTPYRIINEDGCHGCFNDNKLQHEGLTDYFCPKYANSDKMFCCSTNITPWQVTHTISRMPEFQAMIKKNGMMSGICFKRSADKEPFSMYIKNVQSSCKSNEKDVE